MRREPDFFGDQDLELIYIAKRLRDALELEDLLTKAGLDYLVETDTYRGGIIFVTERVGAFFYVAPPAAEQTRGVMRGSGWRPYRPLSQRERKSE